MSIKTLKRIALGVIAGLVFAPFAAIAPASASGSLSVYVVDVGASAVGGADAESDLTNTTDLNAFRSGSTDIGILVQRVGITGLIPVKLVFTTSPDANAPVGTVITADVANDIAVATNQDILFADDDGAGAAGDPTDGNTGAAVDEIFTIFQLDEDTINVTGNYAGTVWVDSDADNVVDAGETQAAFDFTIGGTPETVTGSFSPNPVDAAAGANSVTPTFTFKDEDGYTTALDGDDVLEIEATDAFTDEAAIVDSTDLTRLSNGSYIGSGADGLLTPGTAGAYTTITMNFDDAGDAVFETELSATLAITVRTLATDPTSITLTTTTGVDLGSAATDNGILNDADVAEAVGLDPDVVTTLNFKIIGDAGDFVTVIVAKPAANAAANVAAGTSLVRIGADGTAFFNLTVSGGVDEKIFTVALDDAGGDFVFTFTYAVDVPVLTVDVEASYKAAISTAQTFKVRIRDQFGVALASTAITATVTGRNPATFRSTPDANGYATFTWTDAGAAVGTTTATSTDTVTFSATGATSVARTVTYSTAGPAVVTVTVTNDEAGNAHNIDPVEAVAGLPAGYVTYTIRVTDASGQPISGVRVSATGNAGDLFYLGDAVGVTAAVTGETTINAYRRLAGTAGIVVTAGSVTARDLTPVTWSAVSSGARNVSISVSNATAAPEGIIRVTATVSDRFGNAVPLANVTLTENGAGRLYTGETASKTTTRGVVSWDLTSLKLEAGANLLTATVTAVDVDNNGTVGAAEGLAQMNDIAGYIATTAVTGVSAGNDDASTTVTFAAAAAPVVVAPSVAPSLTAERQGNRVLLFGSCMVDEGDMIIYVKSPGKAWSEKAKTLECAAGEYDGDTRASKKAKFYRVKQEGTGLWSTSKLVRP